MELKTIFQMTKTDRYTQDGRDELAKLQETEDVTYKTGDISQKTGLQKQPDGSWAPPKKGGKPAAKKEAGSINRTPERIAKETAIMEALNLSTGEDNNLHKMSDETIERLYARTQEKPAAGKKDAAKPTTEELSTFKDIVREYKKNPNKQTEQIMNEAKSHLMKNRGMTPEQLGKIGREVMAESESKPAAPSTSEIATSLDEITKPNGGTKNIGGVKVTYDPQHGYRVTHKAPSGKELTTGYDGIEEAHQAVKFRLNRIKNGEIPAITESAENKPADMLSSKDPAILNKYKPETEEEKNEIKKMQQFMEEETGATLRNAILARESYYNNSPSEYKNEAGKAALSNIKKIFGYGTQKDAAPRQLTGDTRIRVKK